LGVVGEPNLERFSALNLAVWAWCRQENLQPVVTEWRFTVIAKFESNWKENIDVSWGGARKTKTAGQVMTDYTRLDKFKTQMGRRLNQTETVIYLCGCFDCLYTKAGFIGTILEDAEFTSPTSQSLNADAAVKRL